MEGYYRMKFPLIFLANEWLGDFIDQLNAAVAGNPLFPFKSDLAELNDLNNYSKKYHHAGQSGGGEKIDASELETYTKRTLALIQK